MATQLNIINTITQSASNSSINFQIAFNHFVYGISKYESVATSATLVGANNIVRPYIDCHIKATNPIVLAVVTACI